MKKWCPATCDLCTLGNSCYYDFTTHECGLDNAFGRICLSVCLVHITFETLDLERSFLIRTYIFGIFSSSRLSRSSVKVKVKVTGTKTGWIRNNTCH